MATKWICLWVASYLLTWTKLKSFWEKRLFSPSQLFIDVLCFNFMEVKLVYQTQIVLLSLKCFLCCLVKPLLIQYTARSYCLFWLSCHTLLLWLVVYSVVRFFFFFWTILALNIPLFAKEFSIYRCCFHCCCYCGISIVFLFYSFNLLCQPVAS